MLMRLVILICLMLRKIFSLITTNQGPILALVYPWHTNTKYSRKTKWIHLYIQNYLNFYIHNIYSSSIKKKENTNVSKQEEIYTYSSMNKQYVEGVQKWKIDYLPFLGWVLLKEQLYCLISPNYWYNRFNYEMLIRIIHFLVKRNINIIMDLW